MVVDDDLYEQEACLGRVKMRRSKKKDDQIRYLVKWRGWDAIGDITTEPSSNVLVPKVEEPVLDQSSPTFEEELTALLKAHLDGAAASRGASLAPVSAGIPEAAEAKRTVKEEKDAEQTSKKRPAALADKVPKAKSQKVAQDDAKDGKRRPAGTTPPGGLYTAQERQFFVVADDRVHREAGLLAVFIKVQKAAMNPGLGWTIRSSLLATGAHPDAAVLNGSVDRMSEHCGFGWFHNELSGVSLAGIRHFHPVCDDSRFTEGDTVGVVVDTDASTGYCVRNGRTVFTVHFAPCTTQPMLFAIHLCKGDEVILCAPPAKLDDFVVADTFEVHPGHLSRGGVLIAGSALPDPTSR